MEISDLRENLRVTPAEGRIHSHREVFTWLTGRSYRCSDGLCRYLGVRCCCAGLQCLVRAEREGDCMCDENSDVTLTQENSWWGRPRDSAPMCAPLSVVPAADSGTRKELKRAPWWEFVGVGGVDGSRVLFPVGNSSRKLDETRKHVAEAVTCLPVDSKGKTEPSTVSEGCRCVSGAAGNAAVTPGSRGRQRGRDSGQQLPTARGDGTPCFAPLLLRPFRPDMSWTAAGVRDPRTARGWRTGYPASSGAWFSGAHGRSLDWHEGTLGWDLVKASVKSLWEFCSLVEVQSITTQHTAVQSITTQHTAVQSITTQHTAVQSITTQHTAVQSITTQHTAVQSITTQHTAVQSITTQHTAVQSITTQHTAVQSITTQHTAVQSITTQHTAVQSITTQHTAVQSITTQHTAVQSITTQHTAVQSITTQHTAVQSITTQHTAVQSITTQHTAVQSITTQHTAVQSITTQHTAVQSITAQHTAVQYSLSLRSTQQYSAVYHCAAHSSTV
ncbi:SELPL protein, partial [Atractosteus spatula]|nr:SELPL protein [Atractosteus spatula]